MLARFALPLAAFALLPLSACNSAQTPTAVAPVAASPAVIPPAGAGCAAAVARYHAIVDNDLSMGHVDRSVHAAIVAEIDRASSACSAGRDGEALALLRASRSRHGYPG